MEIPARHGQGAHLLDPGPGLLAAGNLAGAIRRTPAAADLQQTGTRVGGGVVGVIVGAHPLFADDDLGADLAVDQPGAEDLLAEILAVLLLAHARAGDLLAELFHGRLVVRQNALQGALHLLVAHLEVELVRLLDHQLLVDELFDDGPAHLPHDLVQLLRGRLLGHLLKDGLAHLVDLGQGDGVLVDHGDTAVHHVGIGEGGKDGEQDKQTERQDSGGHGCVHRRGWEGRAQAISMVADVSYLPGSRYRRNGFPENGRSGRARHLLTAGRPGR